MNTNQKAALLIRSLMHNLRVSQHLVFPAQGVEGPTIVSSVVLEELEADSDFRAGWDALEDALGVQCEPFSITLEQALTARKSA